MHRGAGTIRFVLTMLDAANDRPAPLTPSSSERPEVTPGNGASRGPLVGGVEHRRSQHTTDADCTVGDDLCCTGCGVSHGGAACGECGAVAFHRDGCAEIEDSEEPETLHILSIEPDFDEQYGHSYRVAYALDGETVRVTEFARQGRHDDWSVVGGQELAESHFAFGEIADIITEEVEGRDVATVAAENLTRAREWLAFREGADPDAMLPSTVEIPVLTMREVADLWLAEQAMRQHGGGGL